MPSIFEVAKQAGVSASTVSRTFNSPHLINDVTKRRVLETAEKLNYRPLKSRTRRETHHTSFGTYGFHFFAERQEDTLQGNAFYSQVLAGALAESSALGVRLILSTSGRHESIAVLPPMVRDSNLSGTLLVGEPDPQLVETYVKAMDHVVFVDTHDPTGKCDSIVTDNFGGSMDAASYLIERGHKRIGFVSGSEAVDSYNLRLYGYVSAHYVAGLDVDRSIMIPRDTQAIGTLLARKDRPSAIMAASDDSAIWVMQACHETGVRIPQDLSLIGFDDLQVSANVIPALTSVHVPTDSLGRLGVRRLHARITEASTPGLTLTRSVTNVPVSIIERGSCRRIL